MVNGKHKETKPAEQKWKAETSREQRKARLAEMKSRDGKKKPVQQTSRKAKIISTLVVLALLLSVATWLVVRMGVPHRTLTAVTVAGESITPVEMSYYYRSLLNSYGIDPNTAEGQATLRSPSGMEEDQTVKEFILNQAAIQVQEEIILNQYARQAELTMTADQQAQVDDFFQRLEETARRSSMTLDHYLSTTYGTGMTREIFGRIIERGVLADQASAHKIDTFTFSAAEVEAHYAETPEAFDVADYRAFYMEADIPTGATEATRITALQEAEDRAEEMLAQITDEESFRRLSIEYAPEDQQASYEESDRTLIRGRKNSQVNPLTVRNWVFGDGRNPGDRAVVESARGYYVLYFIDRYRPTDPYVDIRHILIMASESSSSQVLDEAREEAESILETYLAGDRREEDFADLAREFSADGNAAQGGIYTNVFPGQMVAPFEDWCFDPARQPGDTGIVQTQFGFHVMYFIRQSGEAWRIDVESELGDQAFRNYINAEKTSFPYQVNRISMRFVS